MLLVLEFSCFAAKGIEFRFLGSSFLKQSIFLGTKDATFIKNLGAKCAYAEQNSFAEGRVGGEGGRELNEQQKFLGMLKAAPLLSLYCTQGPCAKQMLSPTSSVATLRC